MSLFIQATLTQCVGDVKREFPAALLALCSCTPPTCLAKSYPNQSALPAGNIWMALKMLNFAWLKRSGCMA
jgi:hypothetical protein